jgi:tetratricopeptide (TPR) repeat protein
VHHKNEIVRLFKKNQVEESFSKLQNLLNDYPDDHELHFFLGMVHGSRFNYFDANRSFQRALELRPGYGDAYFELGVIATTLCRYQSAVDLFRRAKSAKVRVAEAESYLQKLKQKAAADQNREITLSVCLIVKNEERHLSNCLRSVQAIADEIVVVDTGSQDNTVAIAQQFGAKIYRYEWLKDFAAARNFANEKATGDWILQLDADEELFAEDQHKVREFIQQNNSSGAYLALHNRVSSSFGESKPTIHYLVRLFRNSPDFFYENTIHEVLKISGEVKAVDINILHHGYNLQTDDMLQKRRRNAEILYGRYKEDPDSVTTLFYLSMLHIGNHEYDLAEAFANKVLEKIDDGNIQKQHLYLMTLNNLAIIYLEKQNYGTAEAFCLRAISKNENYLDPHYFLGLIYLRQGRHEKAREVYETYLEIYERTARNPVFNLFASSSLTYLFQVYHTLGKIHRREKRSELAKEMFEKSIALNPNFWIACVDLGYLYGDLKEWQMAERYLGRAIKIAKGSPSVNRNNKTVWFDFVNALKNYVRVLRQLPKQEYVSCQDHWYSK